MLSLCVLADRDFTAHPAEADDWRAWLQELAAGGRAFMLDNGDRWSWYAAERAGVVRAAYGLTPPLPGEAAAQDEERGVAVAEVVRARAESSGPFTAAGLAELLALDERAVTQAIARLETQGLVLRGRFRPSAPTAPRSSATGVSSLASTAARSGACAVRSSRSRSRVSSDFSWSGST